MQSKLIQQTYKQAKILARDMFPESVLFSPDKFPSDWRIWQLNRSNKLKVFLIFAPSPKDDDFALEIAWSIHDRLPPFIGLHPDEDRGDGEMRFRLSHLWHRYGAEHRWYLGSARGTEAMRPRAVEIPAGLEFLSNIPGDPNNKDFVEKLRELGLDVTVPLYESLEVKLQSVEPQIKDAFDKLKQYGIPYLQSVCKKYGADLVVKA